MAAAASGSELSGGCHCGNLKLKMTLSRAADTYDPRACDCDFCIPHSAAYVSDPQGSLAIQMEDSSRLARYRQGSGQAEFLLCSGCGVLVGVVYEAEGRLYGAANARAFEGGAPFGPPGTASPKRLTPDEKSARWRTVWFSQVSIGGA
jgi:hypothetical protein